MGLVEMSTWVRFFWRVPMQTESEVELLGTTVSVTVDPMDETTLVAIRLTGLTSHDFVRRDGRMAGWPDRELGHAVVGANSGALRLAVVGA